MLERLYIDNFRCLVNFELKLEPINLLLGANGCGKTSVFDVIRRLQDFIIGNSRIRDVFPASDLTRWQMSKLQRFELELALNNDRFTYVLLVQHDKDLRQMRVQEERLDFSGKPLFSCKEGVAQLYRDNHSLGPEYPIDWSLSGVGALHERPDNKNLTLFKRELSKLIVVRPIPALMECESREEQKRLTFQMENFTSWYRRLPLEHMGAMNTLLDKLQQVLPGFESLSLKESGEESRALKAHFAHPDGGKSMSFGFSELSDGQRMLIALYTLVFGMKDESLSLLIDEPDNFLALREVQPWLSSLADAVGESVEQTVLISHHPEIINYLGNAHGQWFDRDAQGPVRITDKQNLSVGSLTLAELMARGWEK